MPILSRFLASAAALLAAAPAALTSFSSSSSQNIAVYWGQNTFGQGSGSSAQKNLASYCANIDIDVILLAFQNGITPPINNFTYSGNDCTPFVDNSNLLSCPEIAVDIQTCQSKYGKTIILSLGGATYTQGGWPSASVAESAAESVWAMFGPVQCGSKVDRPFGSAVVDGFDFDFEAVSDNLLAFGVKLRSLMDSAGGKKFYLSAAPQCPFPDAALGSTLDAVAFDFIMIQFYNNYCGVANFQPGAATQNRFNFDVWNKWAKGSKNPQVKTFLGIPANSEAGGGYTDGAQLKAAIAYSKEYTSFGGVMMWDMSQLYANDGFLNQVVGDIACEDDEQLIMR